MTDYRCIRFITHNGEDFKVGSIITLDSKKDATTIAHLKNNKAIESLEVIEEESVDIVENLMKINGITKTIAQKLIEQGITTVDQLGVLELKGIEELDGVSKAIAKKIYNAFVPKE